MAEVRNVVVYELLSLDGVAEAPNEFIAEWDDVVDANLASVIGSQDAVILGRRSYDDWAPYWPPSPIEPFASFINNVEKYVVTSSPLDVPWANSTAIEGDLETFVHSLKAKPGGDIGVHASLSVAQTLLAAGLVDELRLVIAPALVGRGRRFLKGISVPVTLVTSVASPSGHQVVRYRVG